MSTQSLNDKAIEALALIKEVGEAMQGINDYGEATGFCDDQEGLLQDADSMVTQISRRAYRLKLRIRRQKEAQEAKAP